jgi:hypothetical protein
MNHTGGAVHPFGVGCAQNVHYNISRFIPPFANLIVVEEFYRADFSRAQIIALCPSGLFFGYIQNLMIKMMSISG